MNNKVILENILTLTKSLNTLYLNGTIEASNKEVRKMMEKGLQDSLSMQEEIYQMMVDDGYYQVCNVKSTEIEKLYNKLTKDQE